MMAETHVLYGAETYVTSNRLKQALESTEMDYWRRSCKVAKIGSHQKYQNGKKIENKTTIVDNIKKIS